ncbi:hypothetical protein ILYODFUR_006274 [Ilyodon furcidens]|uniref:Uncharacterized protein n=1 Tax=Ilyodon furcidens TaxID=33524 RepID=A0ABV0T6X8_9TELE
MIIQIFQRTSGTKSGLSKVNKVSGKKNTKANTLASKCWQLPLKYSSMQSVDRSHLSSSAPQNLQHQLRNTEESLEIQGFIWDTWNVGCLRRLVGKRRQTAEGLITASIS